MSESTTSKSDVDKGRQARLRRDAREWHTVMNSGAVDPATRRSFEAWLHASKEHKQAYFALEQMWRDLDFVALEAGVGVPAAAPPPRPWRRRVAFARPAFVAASFALLVVAGLTIHAISTGILSGRAQPAFETQRAEIREIELEDSSLVTLGAKSQLAAVFTEDSRKVVLFEGEAFFDVAKDPLRPFFVAADDTLIRVVGTKFSVKRTPDDVHVAVLEGVVDVMKTDDLADTPDARLSPIETKRLTAGQKIVAAAASPTLPDADTVQQTTPGAWRTGRLAYENASLAEIIADIDRYHDRPIRIVGDALGGVRFTTGFQVREIDTWLAALEETQPIDVIDRGQGEILVRPRR